MTLMAFRPVWSSVSVILVAFSISPAAAQRPQPLTTAASDSAHLHLTLRLASGATQYRQGELILLQLQFTEEQPGEFQVRAESNRWADSSWEEVYVSPATGAVDPLAVYQRPFLEEVRGIWQDSTNTSVPLVGLPATINLPLTDWLRFDQPGHYLVSLRTFRASRLPDTPGAPQHAITLLTNTVEFDVVAADAAWQSRQLKQIAAQNPIDWPRLRALGTADAARFLARHYRGDVYPLDREVLLGLLGSPNKQAGIEEMQGLLRDPDFAVTPPCLEALALLSAPPPESGRNSIAAGLPALRRELFDALPAKRGGALATSKQTYMDGVEQLAAVKFSPDQIEQIIQMFEQLPPSIQDIWLGQRWSQVCDLRWLPVLQRLSSREVNFQQPGDLSVDPVAGITKLALKRWYELDPKAGRAAILREVTSPAPRFGADVLGILPDKTLPEEQHIIAQNFASMAAPPPIAPTPANYRIRYPVFPAYQMAEARVASLLYRYAGGDVAQEVLAAAKNRLPERNCEAQYSEIAFLLKVDSEEAGSFMRAVASNRRYGHGGCALRLFEKIPQVVAYPALERFAIESLEDIDPYVASYAVRYLRDYGSAQAEQPIFDRLVRWNSQWRDLVAGATAHKLANREQASLGFALAQALVCGHGWLADEARTRQILSLTPDPGARGDLEASIRQMEVKPIHIYFMSNNGRAMFLVAQYELESVDDLKHKLSQYPPGAQFVWSDHRSPAHEILDRQVSHEFAQWSSPRGIRIDGLQP